MSGNVVTVTPHGEACSIRKHKRNARGYVMGAVSLKSVTVTVEGLTGIFIEEFAELRELSPEVLKHFTRIFPSERGWFRYVKGNKQEPVTGNTYRAAYVCGTAFYVA